MSQDAVINAFKNGKNKRINVCSLRQKKGQPGLVGLKQLAVLCCEINYPPISL